MNGLDVTANLDGMVTTLWHCPYSQSLLDNLHSFRLMDLVTQVCRPLAACALNLAATGHLTISVDA